MTDPETWFTLYAFARMGAARQRRLITTRQLGQLLGVSQQTASRRVAHCADLGYLNRIHTANGITVQLTEKGQNELTHVLNGLEVAMAPTADEIVIQGQVVDGLGEGAYYVDVYSSRFNEALGFKPFPGTLNVRITDEESRKAAGRMKDSPPLVVRGFNLEGRTFGDVICYRVKINDKTEGAVVVAQRTHHSQDTLEVIAPVNLRKKLNLNSNDAITLRFVPLHLVT